MNNSYMRHFCCLYSPNLRHEDQLVLTLVGDKQVYMSFYVGNWLKIQGKKRNIAATTQNYGKGIQ